MFVFTPMEDFGIQEEITQLQKVGALPNSVLLAKHTVGEAGRCSNYTFSCKGFRELFNPDHAVEY